MRNLLICCLCLLAGSELHAQKYYRIGLSDKLNHLQNSQLINMNERSHEEKLFFKQLAYEDPFIERLPNMLYGKPLSRSTPYGADRLNDGPLVINYTIRNAYSGSLIEDYQGAEITYAQLPQGFKLALYLVAKQGGKWKLYIPSRLLELTSHLGDMKFNEPVELIVDFQQNP